MFILEQKKDSLIKYVVSDDIEKLVDYIMSFSKVKKYSDRFYKDSTGIEFHIYLGEVKK